MQIFYTSTKTTYCDRLKAEADMKIKLFSIQPDIKEIYKKCKNNVTLLTKLLLWKTVIFDRNILTMFVIIFK